MNERPRLVLSVTVLLLFTILNHPVFSQDRERISEWCDGEGITITFKETTLENVLNIPPDSASTAYFDAQGNLLKLCVIKEKLKKIELGTFPNLRSVDLTGNSLKNLADSKFPPAILELVLKQNQNLTGANLKQYSTLQYLDLSRSAVVGISNNDLPTGLISLNLRDCKKLTRLELSNFPELVELDLSFCKLSEFKLNNAPKLQGLRFQYAKFDIIEFNNLLTLPGLDLWDCNVSSIKLTNLPALQNLMITDNPRLKTIDASGLPGLQRFTFSTDRCDLAEVLLAPSNKIYPNVAKIKYAHDGEKRLTAVEYFDSSGGYVDITVTEDGKSITYAKKLITYSGATPTPQLFTAAQLK